MGIRKVARRPGDVTLQLMLLYRRLQKQCHPLPDLQGSLGSGACVVSPFGVQSKVCTPLSNIIVVFAAPGQVDVYLAARALQLSFLRGYRR